MAMLSRSSFLLVWALCLVISAAFGYYEGGHNFGLRHASSFEYGSQPLGDLDQSGTHCEFGNVFSTMGVCSWTAN